MKRVNFNFRMSYANLYATSIEKIAFVKRDAEKFEEFGYNSDKIAGIELLSEQLKNIERDAEKLAVQVLETDARNQKADLLRSLIRKLQVKIELSASDTKPQLVQLIKIQDLSTIPVSELVMETNKVIRMLRKHLESVQPCGISKEMIDNLELNCEEVNQLTLSSKVKIAERDFATGERIELANRLYQSIVEVCKIGRTIWDNENEAYYNDYIIFGSQSSGVPPEEQSEDKPDELDSGDNG